MPRTAPMLERSFSVRAHPSHLARWRKQAKRDGKNVSEWVRDRLLALDQDEVRIQHLAALAELAVIKRMVANLSIDLSAGKKITPARVTEVNEELSKSKFASAAVLLTEAATWMEGESQ